MRVLVVEDDAKIASFVVKGLKQEGYGVDHAPDGDTGLALASSTTYDAAVVDIMLPGLDGLSLVRRLRAARSDVRPVTKIMILEHVWDYSFDPQTNVVDVLMSRLRSKIDPEKTRIETLRGVGYVFKNTV